MNKKDDSSLIVGLDIGTSKVLAIVGEVDDKGELVVIGYGRHESIGMRKGVVANIEKTEKAIQAAIEEAELMADCQIFSVNVGIAAAHISSFNKNGVVLVRDNEVGANDVTRVIENASAVAIPDDQKVLHVIPQEYIIDGQEEIQHPIGMSGTRLETNVHMVTGSVSAAKNIEKCIRRCGLDVDHIVLEQLASCESVLMEDEKELGVCLIDIGGGTTDIAVFSEGAIRHTSVIPIAGDQGTNDIAISLRTPMQSAEEIKIKYGCALPQMVQSEQSIEVPSAGERAPRKLSKHTLSLVLEARFRELFELVAMDLQKNRMKNKMRTGIVLTGGSSRMEGLVELAEETFNLPVRIGVPKYIGGLSEVVKDPCYSTAVGLVQFGHAHSGTQTYFSENASKGASLSDRIVQWFKGNF